jgi:phosphatidylglycerophosphatase A
MIDPSLTPASSSQAEPSLPAPSSLQPQPPLSPPIRPSVLRPSLRFMLSHPAHWFALGFGSGLSRIAPGTVGTLWAWLAYWAMQQYLSPAQIGWVIAASLPIGWWACTVTAKHMGVQDPGSIVWDEVVAMWLILWLIEPASLWAQTVAFVLFRFFDAAKPGPVSWADQLFKGFGWRGGFGIVWDDLVAAGCTLLLIALWRFCL